MKTIAYIQAGFWQKLQADEDLGKEGIKQYIWQVIDYHEQIHTSLSRELIREDPILKEYMRQATMAEGIDCVLWVDKRFREMPWLKVDDPRRILEIDYDKIIIAIEDEGISKEISRDLRNMGIEEGKIIRVNPRK